MKISGHRLSALTSVETAAKTSEQASFLGDPQTALQRASQEGGAFQCPEAACLWSFMERALIGWPGQAAAAADNSFDEILIHLTGLS